jgi:hypothetical protein
MFSPNLALLNQQNLATLSSTGSEQVAQISFFFGFSDSSGICPTSSLWIDERPKDLRDSNVENSF